jgi:hypothetical protein
MFALPVNATATGNTFHDVESIRNFQIVFARQRDKFGKPAVAVNADISAEIFAKRLSAAATPTAMSAYEGAVDG